MKRLISPLVWLCAVCAAALGALAIYDPYDVYAGYAAALPPGTPRIAAVFTAVQDGVYPWSGFWEEEPEQSPVFRPLTGTVTDEEMRSSVGSEEPFRGQPENARVRPSGEFIVPEEPSGETGDNTGTEEVIPSDGFVTVDLSWFDDALFIGDSHTEGLCDYGKLPNATYYYKRGVDVWSVMKKAFVGGSMTIPQALSQQRFGKIYIMLGINEIGCGTTESFAAQYAEVVAQLRELQPDALIYIQSIFHTSQKKSAGSIYNNDTINARNDAIARIADDRHVFFLNCNEVFDDETGALTSSYTGDGVHVKAPYYVMWRDYLCRFGRAAYSQFDSGSAPQSVPGSVFAASSGKIPDWVAGADPGGNPAVPTAPAAPAVPTAPAAPAVPALPAPETDETPEDAPPAETGEAPSEGEDAEGGENSEEPQNGENGESTGDAGNGEDAPEGENDGDAGDTGNGEDDGGGSDSEGGSGDEEPGFEPAQ